MSIDIGFVSAHRLHISAKMQAYAENSKCNACQRKSALTRQGICRYCSADSLTTLGSNGGMRV